MENFGDHWKQICALGQEIKQTVEVDPCLDYSKDRVAVMSYQLSVLIASLNNSAQITVKPTKRCDFCSTSDTPQWRRGPNGVQLCNKCGLSYKATKGLSITPDITKKSLKRKHQKYDPVVTSSSSDEEIEKVDSSKQSLNYILN